MPKIEPGRAGRIALAAAVALGFVLLAVAAFPWGLVAGYGARSLSAAIGRQVAIGSARRVDWLSFSPTVELADVTVAQPGWAGTGAMVRIARARVRFPVFPLLAGHFRPRSLDIDGVRLALRRTADGRANWAGTGKGKRGGGPRIEHLTIAHGALTLVDLRRQVTLAASLASDPVRGLAIVGRGTDRGEPMTLAFHGGALGEADPDAPYPIRLAIASPLTRFEAAGRLDRPLDLSAMTVRAHAAGRDLKLLDDYVQAGLFPTADYDLSGDLRRDGDRWRMTGLAGRVGRSRLKADLAIVTGARTRIDGRVAAATLDFSDFASADERAAGRARAAAAGPRVLPDTRIVLAGLAKVDATLRLDAARLLTEGRGPFRTLSTRVRLDNRVMTLDPLRVGLVSGTMTGRVVNEDRGRTPRLTLDLKVDGATVQVLFPNDQAVQGPFVSRIRLAGRGDTFRAAMADADGTVGIAVSPGTVRRDYATFLGGDLFRSVGAAVAGGDGRVAMGCLVGIFATKDGVMTPDPLILDDALSRGDGTGRITLADERLDLALHGRAKRPGPLVSTAPVRVYGTLSNPQIDIRPPRAEKTGKTSTLDRIGFFLKKLRPRGDLPGRAVAPAANCPALVRKAVG